jgi:2-methylcitrate dehydratase
MSNVLEQIVDFAINLKYEDLPNEVVSHVKRFFLDSVGCAFGGCDTDDVSIYREYYQSIGGSPDASVFAMEQKLPAAHAAMLNALMIRTLDYNDIYWEEDPSHPSDLIPAALTPAELLGKNGKDVITAIALAYEIEMRLCEIAHPGIRERKWHHATFTAFVAPLVAAKVMGFEKTEIMHAVGIGGCHQATFGAVAAGQLTMMKNTVDPMAVQGGVEAAILAGRGYSGPHHVLEGKEGLSETIDSVSWDLESLVCDLGKRYRILRGSMKAFPTEALTHSPISAIMKIQEEQTIVPEEIEDVTIATIARAADILADSTKYHPTARETADHSLPYCIAAMLLDGELTPEQFSVKRINKPDIQQFMSKINVVVDPAFETMFPEKKPASAIVRLKNGDKFSAEVDYPKGDYRNPLTDEEIWAKIRPLMEGCTTSAHAEQIVDVIQDMEQVADIHAFMNILAGRRE